LIITSALFFFFVKDVFLPRIHPRILTVSFRLIYVSCIVWPVMDLLFSICSDVFRKKTLAGKEKHDKIIIGTYVRFLAVEEVIFLTVEFG